MLYKKQFFSDNLQSLYASGLEGQQLLQMRRVAHAREIIAVCVGFGREEIVFNDIREHSDQGRYKPDLVVTQVRGVAT
jgi:hypothetical protein